VLQVDCSNTDEPVRMGSHESRDVVVADHPLTWPTPRTDDQPLDAAAIHCRDRLLHVDAGPRHIGGARTLEQSLHFGHQLVTTQRQLRPGINDPGLGHQ